MSTPAPRLTAITLGVRDIPASTRFYENIGFKRKVKATGDEITFLDGGGVALALWDRKKLADDAAVPPRTSQDFGGATFAWNCATAAEVDEIFAKVAAIGAKILRKPEPSDYGGHRAYFADPDGHVWEIVYAPGFSFTGDGRLVLPD